MTCVQTELDELALKCGSEGVAEPVAEPSRAGDRLLLDGKALPLLSMGTV